MGRPRGSKNPYKPEWLPDKIIVRGVEWDIDEYIDTHLHQALAALIEGLDKRPRNTARR